MPNKRPALTLPLLKQMLAETVRGWFADKASSMGAALAFYSALSLGPLLLIVISIAGLVFGAEAASGHIVNEMRGLIGEDGAQTIQTIIANSRNEEDGWLATMVGLITLLITATAVFGQMQDALNTIWKVEARGSSFMRIIKRRMFSFALIVSIGFLLLTSLVISASLAAFSAHYATLVPESFMHMVNFFVSFVVTTILFAMIFRILPDVTIRWRDVWIGAGITSLLFTLGKIAIGLYLGHSALSSTYGAAGSLLVILIWVYYSTQILFLGAEFTQVYARAMGSPIIPMRGAKRSDT